MPASTLCFTVRITFPSSSRTSMVIFSFLLPIFSFLSPLSFFGFSFFFLSGLNTKVSMAPRPRFFPANIALASNRVPDAWRLIAITAVGGSKKCSVFFIKSFLVDAISRNGRISSRM